MSLRRPVLVVRGIGSDRALAFSQGVVPVDDTEFDLVPAVDRDPKNLASSTDWLTADFSVEGSSWTLSATPLIQEIFMRRVKQAAGYIVDEITLNDTQIKLAPEQNFSAGDTVYINGESMILDSLVSVDGNEAVWNVTRGAFQSRQTEHQKARNVNDRIYLQPRPKGRECFIMWEHEGAFDAEEHVFWQGILEGAEDSEDMAAIQITLRDVTGLNITKSMNDPAYTFRNTSDILVFLEGGRVATGTHEPYGFGQFVDEDPVPNRGGMPDDTMRITLQYEDTLYMIGKETLAYDPGGGNRHPYRPPVPIPSGESENNAGGSNDYSGLHNAVFCYGYAMEEVDGETVNYWGNLPWFAEGEEPSGVPHTNYHHPGHALLVAMLSGTRWVNHDFYDYLGRRWGMGIPADYVDIEGIEEWIISTPDLKVRAGMWGYDGRSWKASDFIKAHTTLWGMYPGHDSRGRFTLHRRRIVTEADIVIGYERVHPMSEGQDQRMYSSASYVRGDQGFPWEDVPDARATDRSEGDDLWRPDFGRAGVTLPGGMMAPVPNVQGEGGLADLLQRALQWARFDIPRITLRVDHDEMIPTGSSISIDESNAPAAYDGVWWNSDGTRNFDEIKGIVVSAQKIWDDGSQEIDVDLVNDPVLGVRVIAPSSRAISIALREGDIYFVEIEKFIAGVDIADIEAGVTPPRKTRFRTYEDQADGDVIAFYDGLGGVYALDVEDTSGILAANTGTPDLVTLGISPILDIAEIYIKLFEPGNAPEDQDAYYV